MGRRAVALALPLVGALAATAATAQSVDPRRAKTVIVGPARGAAPTDRVDPERSGASSAPLPTGTLHVAWRRNVNASVETARGASATIDSPPLVGDRGDVVVLTTRGDLIVLAADGEERTHTAVGSAATPATLTSDGTAVFVTNGGDVVGVRLGDVRFRTHLGGGRAPVAPLALGDGGVVVASLNELVAIDAEGGVRARTLLDPSDPPVYRLIASPRGVLVVTATGGVRAWVPASGQETARVGAFGGPLEGGAALLREGKAGTLLGATGGQLVALDVATGATTTRATASASGALLFAGPPAVHAGSVAVLGLGSSRALALTFDTTGAESLHESIGPSFLPSLPDGGTPAVPLPGHVGVLIDARGAVAFALPSGELGVAAPGRGVDVVSDVCARFGGPNPPPGLTGRTGTTYVGLAPAGPHALVAACGNGVVARIDSDFAPSP